MYVKPKCSLCDSLLETIVPMQYNFFEKGQMRLIVFLGNLLFYYCLPLMSVRRAAVSLSEADSLSLIRLLSCTTYLVFEKERMPYQFSRSHELTSPMILSEAINKVRSMVAQLGQLPKLEELQTKEHARVPEFVVKKKREKIFTHIRPFLAKIESDVADYQSSFTEEMLADARARYEAVCSEVNEIEGLIREHGLAEKIVFVKDLCKKKDFLLSKQRMSDVGPVSDTQQLKAALCSVKDVDTCQFSSEFCGLLSNEVLSGLTLPSQRELDSLSKICDCLREGDGNL